MKLTLAALLALVPLAAVPRPPIESRVYRWSDATAQRRGLRTDRAIAAGSATDLERLEIHAITIAAGAPTDSGSTRMDDERFLMVKEGRLRVTLAGATSVLGAGSVTVAMPGDREVIANADTTPATYYVFTYRSKAPVDLARGRAAGGSFMVDWANLKERPTASGTRRDVFNRPTAMYRKLEAHVSSVSEGLRNHATHTHHDDETMMLTRGTVEMLIGDAHPRASAGDIVFLGSLLPHSLLNVGTEPAQYLVVRGE